MRVDNDVSGTTVRYYNFMFSDKNIPYEPYKETTTLIDMNKHNLFDKDNVSYFNGYLASSSGNIATSSDDKSIYIQCKPSTTYTIQKISSSRFRVGTFAEEPANGMNTTNKVSSDTGTKITITTRSTDNFLLVYLYNISGTVSLQQILNSIQIFEGTSPKPYYELSEISEEDELIIKDKKTYIVKRNNEIVLNGNEDWKYYTGRWNFRLIVDNIKPFDNPSNTTIIPNIKSDRFKTTYWNNADSNGMMTGMKDIPTTISFKNDSFQTLANFKTWLSNNPVTVQYELIEPEIIELPSYNIELFEGYNKITTNDSLEPDMKILIENNETEEIDTYEGSILEFEYKE